MISRRAISNVAWVVALAVGTVTIPASAQELSAQALNQRIQRLERVLDNSVLINMVQRFDALQEEVRQLRGELEQKEFELETMRSRQAKLYEDTDERLSALEERGVGGGLDDLDDLDDISLSELEESLDDSAPVEIASVSGTTAAQSTANTQSDSQREKVAYQDAYDLLILGRNREAIAGFQAFLSEYPDGAYTDNAHYWLGEANYVERRFSTAIDSFDVVIFQFPSSRKVPDARLRKGFALFELQRYPEARDELEIVEREYRGRSIAALARRRLDQMTSAGL
jgi:tol-pal system protein YbgF